MIVHTRYCHSLKLCYSFFVPAQNIFPRIVMTFHVGSRIRFSGGMLYKQVTLFLDEIIVHGCFTLSTAWESTMRRPSRWIFLHILFRIAAGLSFRQPFWCRRLTQIRMVELFELCGNIPTSELFDILLENKFFQLSFPWQSCPWVAIKIASLKFDWVIHIIPFFLTTIVRESDPNSRTFRRWMLCQFGGITYHDLGMLGNCIVRLACHT